LGAQRFSAAMSYLFSAAALAAEGICSRFGGIVEQGLKKLTPMG